VLDKGDLFTDTSVFKKALKWYDVQHEFNFKFKHNDRGRVTAICKEQDCTWRIHVSLDAKKRADVEFLVAKYTPDFKDDPTWTPYAL
jgi:hypothetical protein